MIRLLQYSSKLFGWMAEKCKYDKGVIIKLKNLEYSLGTARKLLRLGKFIDVLYGALKSIHNPDFVIRATLTLAKINSAIYYLNDHVIWLGRVGLVKIDKESWSKRGNRFWFYSLLLLLIRDFYELWLLINMDMRMRSNCGILSSSNGYPSLGSDFCLRSYSSSGSQMGGDTFNMFQPISNFALDHKDVVLDTIKNICDLLIPLSSLGYAKLSPGVVGLCGIISSLVGILTIVDPTYKLVPS
ncbi:hypothetical protein CHUAL_009032 [Chamberlinius hualienensis]